MDHLTLYGRTYARTPALVVESLFHPGGTCSGTFRITKAGIYLSDLQGNERLFIRADGLGPVSVTHDNGRRRYMYAMASVDETWCGRPASYAATVEGAKALAQSVYATA